jgi:hypothetical protein
MDHGVLSRDEPVAGTASVPAPAQPEPSGSLPSGSLPSGSLSSGSVPSIRARTAAVRRFRAGREALLLVAAWFVYSLSRSAADGSLADAQETGRRILEIEQAIGLDIEAAWSTATAASQTLGLLTSYWYASLHYVVTIGVLLWVWRTRHAAYGQVRSALVVSGVIGLVGYVLLPTAPPRLLGDPGLVDVLARFSTSGWWGDAASAPRGLADMTNELAAMPSLHVGWAVWASWAVWSLATRLWVRVAAIVYSVITSVVVVATGNHYVLDVAAGIAVAALSVAVVRWRAQRAAA